ncbi:MAG: hypothetical protein RLZZ450_5547, partial [Pseudomonadota bacterium]
MAMSLPTDRQVVVLAVLLALALPAWPGCSRCSDEPRVPFKLNPLPAPLPEVKPGDGTGADASSAAAFESAVDNPAVGGFKLNLAHVRATLETDLDNDGDRDVLAVSVDDLSRAHLYALKREPTGFSAAQSVTGFLESSTAGCTLANARFLPLSATKAAAALSFKCADPVAQQSSFPSLWLLSLEAVPRVYERLDLIASDA